MAPVFVPSLGSLICIGIQAVAENTVGGKAVKLFASSTILSGLAKVSLVQTPSLISHWEYLLSYPFGTLFAQWEHLLKYRVLVDILQREPYFVIGVCKLRIYLIDKSFWAFHFFIGQMQTVPGSHLFTSVKNRYKIEFNPLRFLSHQFCGISVTFLTKRQTSINWWKKATRNFAIK